MSLSAIILLLALCLLVFAFTRNERTYLSVVVLLMIVAELLQVLPR